MKQSKQTSRAKLRRSSHNKSTGKYVRRWDRTWKNKQRRIRKNAANDTIANREIARAWEAQERRRK